MTPPAIPAQHKNKSDLLHPYLHRLQQILFQRRVQLRAVVLEIFQLFSKRDKNNNYKKRLEKTARKSSLIKRSI